MKDSEAGRREEGESKIATVKKAPSSLKLQLEAKGVATSVGGHGFNTSHMLCFCVNNGILTISGSGWSPSEIWYRLPHVTQCPNKQTMSDVLPNRQ